MGQNICFSSLPRRAQSRHLPCGEARFLSMFPFTIFESILVFPFSHPLHLRRSTQSSHTLVLKAAAWRYFSSNACSFFQQPQLLHRHGVFASFFLSTQCSQKLILSVLFHWPSWYASLYCTKLQPIHRRLGIYFSSISFQLISSRANVSVVVVQGTKEVWGETRDE